MATEWEWPNYGMYSNMGNAMIHGYVITKIMYGNATLEDMNSYLKYVSTIPGYEEAMDTAVRESVYGMLFGHYAP